MYLMNFLLMDFSILFKNITERMENFHGKRKQHFKLIQKSIDEYFENTKEFIQHFTNTHLHNFISKTPNLLHENDCLHINYLSPIF